MVSRNVSRNAFRCFAKQKGSFRLFRCFEKQAVSIKRVSRNTEKVILFREKLNKKRCEVNQSFPILLLFREIFSFLLFRETSEKFRETAARFACFAVSRNSIKPFRQKPYCHLLFSSPEEEVKSHVTVITGLFHEIEMII
jgi:hypothetical protein